LLGNIVNGSEIDRNIINRKNIMARPI